MTCQHFVHCLGAGLLALMVSSTAQADEPEDIIKYRQNVMKATAGHMAAAGAIIQGKVGYRKHLADHGRALEALMKDISGLFPKDSDFGETKALDAVWKKRGEFDKRAKDTAAKAAAFAKAAAGGDAQAQAAGFKELADSCKACHKDFRREEK